MYLNRLGNAIVLLLDKYMAFDLDKVVQLDIAKINLKKAHSLVFRLSDNETKIPFIIWLLENPNSPLALPGKISLLHTNEWCVTDFILTHPTVLHQEKAQSL
jgi:hypothetical protein